MVRLASGGADEAEAAAEGEPEPEGADKESTAFFVATFGAENADIQGAKCKWASPPLADKGDLENAAELEGCIVLVSRGKRERKTCILCTALRGHRICMI